MRHYEIVALVHPDQSEQQDEIIDRYRRIVEDSGGTVHRCEDWGRRKLAYPIQKLFKAGYFLMNIECDPSVKEEIETVFRYNDSIIRSLVLRKDGPVAEQSPILKQIIKKKADEKRQAEEAAEEARKAEEARQAELAKAEEARQAELAAQKEAAEIEAESTDEESQSEEATDGKDEENAVESASTDETDDDNEEVTS